MRNSVKNKKINIGGFTMVEMIVTLSIFCLVSIIILSWQKDIFDLNNLFNKKLTTQEDIRKIIKNFTAELRTTQSSDTSSYPLEQVNKDSFIFYSDLDNDGKREKIRYWLDDKKIKKGVIKSSGQPLVYNPNDEIVVTLAQNIINPNNEIFLYYDQNYDGSTSPLSEPVNISAVRLVKITITIDEDPNRPPAPITETSQVSIRNLKNNL